MATPARNDADPDGVYPSEHGYLYAPIGAMHEEYKARVDDGFVVSWTSDDRGPGLLENR